MAQKKEDHDGWIAVDFDGTLAEYHGWTGPADLGKPILPMVELVKLWLKQGREIRIFTARCWPITEPISPERDLISFLGTGRQHSALSAVVAIEAIRAWCKEHLGQVLTVTCIKDLDMLELYDDRARQVVSNTGRVLGYSTRGLT